MNLLAALKWWREIAIALLTVLCAIAIGSCSHERQQVELVKAEDKVLADRQAEVNAEQARRDAAAGKATIKALELQIDELRADKRVASIPVCVRHETRPDPVPAAAATAAGVAREDAADVSPAPPRDPGPDVGPQVDAVVRECDDLAARHNALVDWVLRTR